MSKIKKDDKKNKKQGSNLKEIDPLDYIRSPDILSDFADPTDSVKPLTGKIINLDTIFPEWNIDGENWFSPISVEQLNSITYPDNLMIESVTSIALFFELSLESNEALVRGKTPKKDKKSKDIHPTELTENLANENGQSLPVVFKDTENNNGKACKFDGFGYDRHFYRYFSSEQDALIEKQNNLRKKIEEQKLNLLNSNQSDKTSLNALEKELESSIMHRNMFLEEPNGIEIDPYICSAYRAILRFGPSIYKNSSSSSLSPDYLWRNIYPKLPSGKPCYNASGKYCVRLFVAGKWRKIYVDDKIPLRSDGLVALSSSSDKYELWPLILSKAVYSVYSACGYSRILPDVEKSAIVPLQQERDIGDDTESDFNAIKPALKISQFVAFAVHLLTGWQASFPVSISDLFQSPMHDNKDKLKTTHSTSSVAIENLLHAITNGGMFNIEDVKEMVDDKTENAMIYVYEYSKDMEEERERLHELQIQNVKEPVVMKTKKQFKEEYQESKSKRDEIVDIITKRENNINRINRYLEGKVSEMFLLVLPIQNKNKKNLENLENLSSRDDDDDSNDEARNVMEKDTLNYRAVTVLGISRTNARSAVDGVVRKNINEVQLLVEWKCDAQESQDFQQVLQKSNGKSTTGFAYDSSNAFQPLPRISKLKYEWISMSELIDCDACIIAVDTKSKTPHSTSFSRYWVPLADQTLVSNEKDKNNAKQKTNLKGKNAKNTASESTLNSISAQQSEQTVSKDPGLPQLTLLKIDLTDDKSLAKNGVKSSMALTIFIHADTMVSNESNFDTNKNSSKQTILPSDVTIVLQELRLDAKDPFIVKFDLDRESFLPITKKTFEIPYSLIENNTTQTSTFEPLILWMRLYTKCSVLLTFSCEFQITINDADKLWTSLGRSIYFQEGHVAATREQTEQLMFRIPLQHNNIDTTKNVVATRDNMDNEEKKSCMVFVHIAERFVERNVSLVVLSNEDDSANVNDGDNLSYTLPRVQGNRIELSSTVSKTIVGRIYPLLANGTITVPSFHWKLLVLSFKPLLEPTRIVQEVPVVSRFSGKYIPNNRLALFRDIVTIEKLSFPIALKLVLKTPLEPNLSSDKNESLNNETVANATEDTFLSLKLYRKSDKALAYEFKGRGAIHCYSIAINKFLNDGESPPSFASLTSSSAVQSGGKAGQKDLKSVNATSKGGSKGVQGVVETIDLILECSIDDRSMVLPSSWKSRYPHMFDRLVTASRTDEEILKGNVLNSGSSDGMSSYRNVALNVNDVLSVKKPSVCPFDWQVDYLSGKITNVSHDTEELEKFAIMKNAWESKSSGRSERAAAALQYYNEKKKRDFVLSNLSKIKKTNFQETSGNIDLNIVENEGKNELLTIENSMMHLLAKALNGDLNDINERYTSILNLPKYQEYIEVLEQIPTVLTADEIEKRKTLKLNEKNVTESKFQEISAKFAAFNVELKNQTKNRIEELIETANANTLKMSSLWTLRENYRLDVEEKNASLNYLLKRASEAKQTQFNIENGVVDNSKGKKSVPLKKK